MRNTPIPPGLTTAETQVYVALNAQAGVRTSEQLAAATGLSVEGADQAVRKLNYRGLAYIHLRGDGGYLRKG